MPRRYASSPRYADPWSLRRPSRVAEPAALLDGRPAAASFFRRGGEDLVQFREAPQSGSTPKSRLPELRRRVSATVAGYRNQGWCTEVQLRTIEALWVDGLSLREHARREGVAPAAVEARIAALHTKAPEFYRWYRLKNLSRRRTRR